MAKLVKTIFIRLRGRVIPIRKHAKLDSELGAFVKIRKARKARRERKMDRALFQFTQIDIRKGKALGKKIAKRKKKLKI